MMLTALLFRAVLEFMDPAPEVPPPPPLSVKVHAPADSVPFAAWWMPRPFVEPFDRRGEPEQEPAPLDPMLVPLVERWAEFNESTPRFRTRFERYIYDEVFGRETRAEGELFCENGMIRIDLRPVRDLPAETVNSIRRNRFGRPYQVVADDKEFCIIAGQSATIVDHKQRTYVRYDGPNPWLAEFNSLVASPFGGFTVAQRARSFSIVAGAKHGKSPYAHLRLTGLWKAWHREYQSVEVMLDPKSGCPYAMQITDPGGTKQTVYVFKEVLRGDRDRLWSVDPFRPEQWDYVELPNHETYEDHH